MDKKTQGRNQSPPGEDVITAADFARYAGISDSAVRKKCRSGAYPGCLKSQTNGGKGWLVPTCHLDATAKAKLYRERRTGKSRDTKGTTPAIVDAGLGTADQNYRDALWDIWEQSTPKQKERAQRRYEIAAAYHRLSQTCAERGQILQELAKAFGNAASKATVWRILRDINGHDESLWIPLLLPEWKGKAGAAPFTEAAWEHICADWGRQEKPSLRAAYRRAKKIAPEKGWVIPSYDTVKDRINALPRDMKTLWREGEKALEKCYPAPKRLYNMPVHDIWCSDGHKADVFVRNEKGEVFRPIVMVWMDVRSRFILGHSVSKTENADLVRRSLHRAITMSNAIPREALLDSGRAYASKEISGGTQNRYRYKVKENEIMGTLTLLGVNILWALPGNGQAKPVERFWQHITEMAKEPDFTRAYCGNKPDAKPEHFERDRAVPLDSFERALERAVSDYHERAHRGDGLNGMSPRLAYESGIGSACVKTPTPAQVRLCLMTAEAVKLRGDEGSIYLNGNRYWASELGKLDSKKQYAVRYDADNLAAPVYLYLEDRLICEVPLFGAIAFRDRDAAKELRNKKREYKKSVKQTAENLAKVQSTYHANFSQDTRQTDATQGTMPRAKVVEPVRLPLQLPRSSAKAQNDDASPLIDSDQFMAILAKKHALK